MKSSKVFENLISLDSFMPEKLVDSFEDSKLDLYTILNLVGMEATNFELMFILTLIVCVYLV